MPNISSSNLEVVEGEEEESCGCSSYEDEEYDDDSEEEEENFGNRSILWLCQEGQIKVARERFEKLLADSQNEEEDVGVVARRRPPSARTTTSSAPSKLQKEMYQIGNDKNYALHELLMGGTNDTNAHSLTILILESGKQWKGQYLTMLVAQPPSHLRTPLHWAAWGNASLHVLQTLVKANPEPLLMRDGKNQGNRTPLGILQHYYGPTSNRDTNNNSNTSSTPIQEKIQYLQSATRSWIQHRVRLEIYKSAIWYFRHPENPLIPFCEKHRKRVAKVKPQPWFVLSIVGYLLQREIQPLVSRILSFVGKDAKGNSTNSKKKRKRKQTK